LRARLPGTDVDEVSKQFEDDSPLLAILTLLLRPSKVGWQDAHAEPPKNVVYSRSKAGFRLLP
jgi:hypothetical protein